MLNRSDEIYSWLALNRIQGLGNISIKNLLDRFGNPDRIFQASLSDLTSVQGVRKDSAQKIILKKFEGDPWDEVEKAEKSGSRIITFSDPIYPLALKEIHDPPMLLYVKGVDIIANQTFVAIVGSRNSTHYGVTAAQEIAQGLARRGIGVVSGLARGIDSAAHRGCLTGKGHTAAILGTGIDIIYPSLNHQLFKQIEVNGTIISEFPIGTTPSPANFPMRNRIISGMSKGVLIVEATKNSGSLITASQALEQGRDVFAVPGSIKSFKSTGCHFLIKQGARLVENADDVLEGLGLNFDDASKTAKSKGIALPPMDESENVIYALIGDYPMHIDQIARESSMKPSDVSSVLTKMELKGIIRQVPGKMFIR
ncbi:MAG: DNA-protecting protein DprA [Deltaproteobacteria bacterium]|nr:DNA-protecting protein DprA [Deltaproteobacteria bacterium]